MTLLLPPYTTGTITVAVGGTTVVGSSTVWADSNAREGDWLRDPVTGYVTIISARGDATHLTVPAWRGAAITAAGYEIYPYSPLRFAGGTAMADVQALFAILNGATVFYQVTGSAPDDSLGEDGNMAIKVNATPWQQWIKSGGTWVSQGTPIGISNKGAWSGATAYAVNDVVGSSGNAYLCILSHTNHVPPNATYWSLLGARGDKGDPGDPGATGAAGAVGATGAVGAVGATGAKGDKGDTGPAPVIVGTSTSVIAVGAGSKTFATQAGNAWVAGVRLRAVNAGGDRVMVGLVSSYTGSSLTLAIDTTQGVGSDNTWTITIAGEQGQQGGPGPAGATGSKGDKGDTGATGAASTVPGPKGDIGQGFSWNASGTLAQRSTYDGQTTGYAFLETDVSPFLLWVKASNTSADWAGPTPVGGNVPVGDLGSVADSILQSFDYGAAA
jgi:hypothetical protein